MTDVAYFCYFAHVLIKKSYLKHWEVRSHVMYDGCHPL